MLYFLISHIPLQLLLILVFRLLWFGQGSPFEQASTRFWPSASLSFPVVQLLRCSCIILCFPLSPKFSHFSKESWFLWGLSNGSLHTHTHIYIIALCLFVHTYWEWWALRGASDCCVVCSAKSPRLCPALCDPMDCSLPGSSLHGILQASGLQWVAMPSARGSSYQGQNLGLMPLALADGFFSTSATGEARGVHYDFLPFHILSDNKNLRW